MEIKRLFKERWKFYFGTYAIGYLISLKATGVPNVLYLIPIKLSAIGLSLIIGNVFYHTSKKVPVYSVTVKSLKYIALFIVITFIFFLIKSVFQQIGIDITPLIGLPD